MPSSSPDRLRQRGSPRPSHRLTKLLGIRPEAAIFDMDGVLADTEPLNQRALYAVLADHGASLTDAEYAGLIGLSNDATWRTLADRFGFTMPAATLEGEYLAALLPVIALAAEPGDGVRELLAAIDADGIPLAVASSSPRVAVDAVLAALELREAFAAIVSDEQVPRGKPAPDIFLQAARRLGAEPRRCVVIEDSRHGLTAARAAGMATIGLRTRFTDGAPLEADLVIGSLRDLLGSGRGAGAPEGPS